MKESPMDIGIIGLGYVGSAMAAMTQFVGGHNVVAYDLKPEVRNRLIEGDFAEPQVRDYLRDNDKLRGSVRVVEHLRDAVVGRTCVMVCVGTPSLLDGRQDASQLREVISSLVQHIDAARPPWVVVRSTVLPNVHRMIVDQLPASVKPRYVVHPEFLREGTAVSDFMNRDLEVFGCDPGVRSDVTQLARELYPGEGDITRVILGIEEAALVKYASNLLHATKVAFANEVGTICREFGASACHVMDAVIASKLNTSGAYLTPGYPFGGSCLVKDTTAIGSALTGSYPLIRSIDESNLVHAEALIRNILHTFGQQGSAHFGLYGIAFKADTDDCRNSVAVTVAQRLLADQHRVTAFDPVVSVSPIPEESFSLSNDVAVLLACDVVIAFHKVTYEHWSLLNGKQVLDADDLLFSKSLKGAE